jgi:hypothetical protein
MQLGSAGSYLFFLGQQRRRGDGAEARENTLTTLYQLQQKAHELVRSDDAQRIIPPGKASRRKWLLSFLYRFDGIITLARKYADPEWDGFDLAAEAQRVRRLTDTLERQAKWLELVPDVWEGESKAQAAAAPAGAKLLHSGPPAGDAPPADGPADPFTDFIRHQRTLLLTLWRKGKVPTKTVLKALYDTDSDDNREALEGVIKRTNKKLTTAKTPQRFEVKRKGEFLELSEV